MFTHIFEESISSSFPKALLNYAQPQMVRGAPTAITSPVLDSKLPVSSIPSVLPSSTHHFSPASPRPSPWLNFSLLCFGLGRCPEPLILQKDLSTDTDATTLWATQSGLLYFGKSEGSTHHEKLCEVPFMSRKMVFWGISPVRWAL